MSKVALSLISVWIACVREVAGEATYGFRADIQDVSNVFGKMQKEKQNKTRQHLNSTGDDGDPDCEKGVLDDSMVLCCPSQCGTACGKHRLCKAPEKFLENFGIGADKCCKDLQGKIPTCDSAKAPCTMKGGIGDSLRKWSQSMQDCTKATCGHRVSSSLAALKGDFMVKLYLEGSSKFLQAIAIATKIMYKTEKLLEDNTAATEKYDAKIASASDADKEVNPLTGLSKVMKWRDSRDDAEAEVDFYTLILKNGDEVKKNAQNGIKAVDAMKVTAGEVEDIEPLKLKLDTLLGRALLLTRDAESLNQQWGDSSKDYNCSAPPAVKHAASVCTEGNTKHQRKCNVVCAKGYDGEGTRNALRCSRQGKIGQKLYGEWMGMAACVGKLCGQPPKIDNANSVVQDIRHAHSAAYICHEGFEDKAGHSSFKVACGPDGHFQKNMSHVCKPVNCGAAPALKNTAPVPGTFHYTDVATYKCSDGHTIDEMPGGLKEFSISCQSTATFSQGVGCKRVRCGPPPDFEHTDLVSPQRTDDQFVGDQSKFRCQKGYTTNQDARGPVDFTLVCSADGEFHSAGSNAPPTKCSPVAAGVPPAVKNGKFMQHEMFYGDSVLVLADAGYSTTGKAMKEPSFTLSVTAEGTFDGEEKFVPVVCGKPPAVTKATLKFDKPEARYPDVVNYECEDGYSTSTEGVDAQTGSSFTVQCEADGSFSQVPGFGKCANIDDCIGHTCGPQGTCEDHLMNYTCKCESGFEQRKDAETQELHCGNINDCGPESCGVGKCIDKVNDYDCECPTGYEMVEEFAGTNTTESGEADKVDKTCVPVSCGTPAQIDNGGTMPIEQQDQKSHYKDELTYKCDHGYSIDGKVSGDKEFSIECQADEKFTDMKECQPVACDKVPKVAGAATESSSAVFNETVRYGCEKGHSIDGTGEGPTSFSMICLATGEFVEVEDGFKTGGWGHGCKPVSCGEPQDVPNSFRPSKKLVYADSVEYECFKGFTLDGEKDGKTKFKVECGEDGTLTQAKQCLPKACGKPLPEKVLYASTKDEGVVRYPMNTEVICKDGYAVGGDANGNKTFVVACLASGEFESYDPKKCLPVVCGKPPSLADATFQKLKSNIVNRETLNFGERALYECRAGFTTGGEWDAPTEFAVECLASGQFSAPANQMQCRNVNDCEGHTCGPKGSCVDEIGPAPAYTCQCEAGFHIEMVDGEKICGKDACKQHDCGVGLCTDLIGDYTCTCPSGYFVGDKDGSKTCIPVQCTATPPIVTFGKMLTSHTGAVAFPVTLRYECDTGHSVDGTVSTSKKQFQTQCRADAQLHGLMGCQKISCGTAHVLPFVKLRSPSSPSISVDYNEKAKYECDEGYTIKGQNNGATTFEVICQETGHLTDPEVCEPVKCGRAPTVEKTQIAISGDVFYGQEVVYRCIMGYTLDGTSSGASSFNRRCSITGDFSPMDADTGQSCKPISANVPSLANADLTKYAGQPITSIPSHVTYPNGLEYTCKPGHSANGSPSGHARLSTRVDSTGAFTPTLPTECKVIKYSIRGQVKNARNGRMMDGVKVTVDGTSNTATTHNGVFTLQDVASGPVKLVYVKSDYIQTMKQLQVADNVESGGISDISMSPEMSNDQWRIVLKWGARPRDLDTYLKWGSSKVWYGRKSSSSSGIQGLLEHDDTSSYGPETLYVTGVGGCSGGASRCDLRYYVNDYTRTGDMKTEGAEVTLYTGSRVAGSWKIRDCTQSVSANGNWWHVFTVDATSNRLKWSCDMGPSPLPAHLTLMSQIPADVSNSSKPHLVDLLSDSAAPQKAFKQHLRARPAHSL